MIRRVGRHLVVEVFTMTKISWSHTDTKQPAMCLSWFTKCGSSFLFWPIFWENTNISVKHSWTHNVSMETLSCKEEADPPGWAAGCSPLEFRLDSSNNNLHFEVELRNRRKGHHGGCGVSSWENPCYTTRNVLFSEPTTQSHKTQ